ncbi:unnamed protein product [Linum trigynum]|uniref:Uncharacterized protein n=1 Tax=Linum trigynum TaxID=586398 RepID=A0AAV2FW56_9ROSI
MGRPYQLSTSLHLDPSRRHHRPCFPSPALRPNQAAPQLRQSISSLRRPYRCRLQSDRLRLLGYLPAAAGGGATRCMRRDAAGRGFLRRCARRGKGGRVERSGAAAGGGATRWRRRGGEGGSAEGLSGAVECFWRGREST